MSKRNVVILDASTLGAINGIRDLEQWGDLKIYETTSPHETSERIRDAHIVLTNKVLINKAIIEEAKNLEYIGVLATGTNNIDLDAAQKKGVVVRNVANYSTESVAQHTYTMLFTLLSQINYLNNYVFEGSYARSPIFTCLDRPFWELKSKVLGIVGLGNIGKRVAEIGTAFGAKVVYYSTSGNNTNASYKQLSWEELLQQSDVISIHAPLNEHTKNLFDAEAFSAMKEEAILLNLGRGGIVNEKSLTAALINNKIAAAGLDVLENEPISADNPLLQVTNGRLLITPHVAWSSIEARTKLLELTIENLKEHYA